MDKVTYQHEILPQHAQEMLKAAAQVKGIHTREEAIDAATAAIAMQHPEKFRKRENSDRNA